MVFARLGENLRTGLCTHLRPRGAQATKVGNHCSTTLINKIITGSQTIAVNNIKNYLLKVFIYMQIVYPYSFDTLCK